MDHEQVLEALQRSSTDTQFNDMRRVVDWLAARLYMSRGAANLARNAIDFAWHQRAPEILLSVALMMVPDGWNGDISFGRGASRSVLFSPTFVTSGDEMPVDAEHQIPAIALAMAVVKARP